MNRRSIAIGVFKNPIIQQCLKEGTLTVSQISKLIVEELMIDEDLLDEASSQLLSVKGGIRRATNPKNDPEKLKQNIEVIKQNLEGKTIKHASFDALEETEKIAALKYAEMRFKYAEKALDMLSRDDTAAEAAEIIDNDEQKDPTPEAETDEIEGTVFNPEYWDTRAGDSAAPDAEKMVIAVYKAIVSWVDAKEVPVAQIDHFINGNLGNSTVQKKFIESVKVIGSVEKALELIKTQEGIPQQEIYSQVFISVFEKLSVGGEEAPVELDLAAAEAKYGSALKAFGDNYDLLLKVTAILMSGEQLQEGSLVGLKKAMEAAGVPWQKGSAKAIKKHLSREERSSLIKSLNDPEVLQSYAKVLAGQADEKEPENLEDAVKGISKELRQRFEAGFRDFEKRFMKVATLSEQSEIFKNLWDPTREMAETMKDGLDKEEAALTDRAPETTMAEVEEEEEQPQENVYQNKVIDSSRVIQRHVDRIEEVLAIYEKIVATDKKLTMGSYDTLKKYGEKNPKKLLYQLLKLIIKDIDEINAYIDAALTAAADKEKQDQMSRGGAEPGNWQGTGEDDRVDVQDTTMQEQEAPTAQPETELSRKDKILKVGEVYVAVKPLGHELLQTLQKITASQEPPADPNEMNEEVPPAGAADPEGRGPDKEIAKTAKDMAFKIYEQMQIIKEFIPTANPLKTEYGIE